MKKYFLLLICTTCFVVSCAKKSEKDSNSLVDDFESLRAEFESDAIWPQFDSDSLLLKKEKLSSLLERIEADGVEGRTKEELINIDMLQLIITDELEALKFGIHEFPLNAEGGFLTGIVFGVRGARLGDSKSNQNYLDKLEALPKYIDDRIAHMRTGMKRGVLSPKLIANLCLGMVEEVLQTEVEQSFFVRPAIGTEIEGKVSSIVKEQIIPSYQKLSEFFKEEYIPAAPEEIGVRSITGGEKYYEHRVRYFATDDISPQEVFDIGMAEVQRIRTEMDQIIKDVNFNGSFEDFQEFLRTSPQFYAKTPQEILDRAAWITKHMEGELPKYFGRLPRMPLTVKPVPAAIAPNYTSGRYSPGSYKNQKAGEYWVNTTKLDSRPLYALPALTLHEGVPGHHTQIMLAAEMELPDFRRSTYLSAFGEGWALYCEYLGKEAGIYTTAYEDYGRLVYEMWRACRLVVDPGMHYLGWSREKAFNFMKDNTALSILEIDNEINRYIGWPGQAISYKLGELKIKELRNYAENELGDSFEITQFLDVILSNGSIPLNTLERITKEWVATQKMM